MSYTRKISLLFLFVLVFSLSIVIVQAQESPNVTSVRPTAGTVFNNSQVIELGVDASDDSGIANVTAYLTYPNGSVQVIVLSNPSGVVYNTTFVTPSIAGRYNVTYNTTDVGNNVTSNMTNFNVSLLPDAKFASPSSASGDVKEILVNISTQSSNPGTIVVYLFNSSKDLIRTNFTIGNNSFFVNYSNLTEGDYTVNATVNDTNGVLNFTGNRTYTVDRTGPTVSIETGTRTKNTLNFDITVTNGPGSGLCTADRSGAEISGTSSSQIMTETGLNCGLEYTYVVTCTDDAGNEGTATKSASTTSCSSGGGGGGGGGGGSTSTSTWTATFAAGTLEEVYEKSLAPQERVRVDLDGEDHFVGVLSISGDLVTLEVESDPQEIEVREGETQKVEVTNDNFYDLLIGVTSVQDGEANVTIEKIHEEIPAIVEEEPAESETEIEEMLEDMGAEDIEDIPAEGPGTGATAVIIVVVVVLIIVGVLLIWNNRHKFEHQ